MYAIIPPFFDKRQTKNCAVEQSVRSNRTSSAIFIQPSSHAAACHRQKTRWHRKCRAVLRPCFGYDSFLSDLSEAGLPRMTSTALRWTPKRHPFTRTNTRHTNKTPQTAQRYAVDPLSSVCPTPFPVKKTLKTTLQFAFGRCKHPFVANKRLKMRLS